MPRVFNIHQILRGEMKKQTIDYLLNVSSFIGLIFTVVVTMVSIQDGGFTNSSMGVIAALAIVNVMLCILLASQSRRVSFLNLIKSKRLSSQNRLKKVIEDKSLIINDICETTHNINDQMRDRIFELFDNYSRELNEADPQEKSNPDVLLQNFRRTNEMFHLFLIDNVRNAFESITGDKCSTCIKILALDDYSEDILVRTYIRDSNSYRARKGSDDEIFEYAYYENTAFKTILSSGNNASYYACDDLSSESTYINLNDGWKSIYNATLVAPIRMKLGSPATEYSVIGFICVDNKGGGLNNEACINLLASIADSLYSHFVLLNGLLGKLEERSSATAQGV